MLLIYFTLANMTLLMTSLQLKQNCFQNRQKLTEILFNNFIFA